MRPIIQPLSLTVLLGTAASSWAQNNAKPSESGVTGTVYRCTLQDGTRWYKSKLIPGADCVAISYKPQAVGTGNSAPAGWSYLTSSAAADTYVQPSSIKRNGESVGVWVMENYKEPQTNNFTRAPFQSAMRRLSIKCDDRQITAQKTTFTAEPFGRGDYVGEWRPLGVYGDFATPGSVDDAIAAYVCRSK